MAPDLNPLDYAFWSEVNKRLREKEATFADDFREPRGAFTRRLRRTIVGAPAPHVGEHGWQHA